MLYPCRPAQTLSTVFALLALTACGGGDETTTAVPAVAAAPSPAPGPAPAPAPTPPAPPPAVSTTVSGAVVKGPVAGAQVCAYTVVANGRGSALGSCTTSDASGHYSFAVPAGTGPLWVEATGGTYTDEVTGATATLPAGSPLRSIITANAGTVNTMLTPLTTLALNAAAATVGSNGTLNAAAFQSAATQLLGTFNLPATLNVTGTTPAFGSGINSYGTALTAISQMVANGSTLASILAATQPQALAAAYATAASPPVIPPVTPPVIPPATGGMPSASGAITATGSVAGSITPQATGSEITTSASTTTHRFFLTPVAVAGYPASVTSTAEVKVTRSAGSASVSYADPRVTLSPALCDVRVSSTCGITFSTPAGATHPVTVTFTNTPLVGGGTLNGTLVGDAPGALWSAAELPRSTDGAIAINGVSTQVDSGNIQDIGGGGVGNTLLAISMFMADGSTVVLGRTNGLPLSIRRTLTAPQSIALCDTACNVTVTASAEGMAVVFANSPLSGGVMLNQSVFIGKTQGAVTNNGQLGTLTPISDTFQSVNDRRYTTFIAPGSTPPSEIGYLQVTVRGGQVIGVNATSTNFASYQCGEAVTALGYPLCSGIAVGANGRSFTFTNATLAGGAIGGAKANVVFNGTLTAKGQ